MQTFSYHNQKLEYNHDTKTAFTEIDEPFKTAGRQLGWEENVPGLGFNLNIMAFVLKTKCTLIVRVHGIGGGNDYFISHDKLEQFLKTHNCQYEKSGVQLRVISWKKFIRVPRHSET